MKEKVYDGAVGEEKAKRTKPLTLVSGIFGVLIGVALVALAVFVSYSMLSTFWVKDTSSAAEAISFVFLGWLIIPFLLLIGGLILVVAILNIVSGSLAIAASTKDDKNYLARKGLIVTSIVFDFILVLALGIFALTQLSNKSDGAQTFALILGLGTIVSLVCGTIKIIDISIVSKRHKKQIKYEKEQKKLQADNAVENNLAKYKDMLEKGVITKEEYDKLRAKELGLNKEE